MINRTRALWVVRQCQLLGLSRSTASYQPTLVSATALALMRRIDGRHLPAVCWRTDAAGPAEVRGAYDQAQARAHPDDA